MLSSSTNPGAWRPAHYLAGLSFGRAVLWCYLIWYLVAVAFHFDATPRLWATSLGLSLIIGVALVLNAAGARLDGWQRLRFFLAPFCVSSFSALVKGKGFVLIFAPRWGEVAAGLGAIAAFLALVAAARALHSSVTASPTAMGPG
jgi:hypothetical protein